ncbi:MAG: transposase [Candidatus Omnitrophica bacterium]|nr:transposase [Candidatus Omnitrophota bacterium]
MARLPRIYLENALYYITNQGLQNQEIFKQETDFKTFLELLKKYKEQYGCKLFAFVLLPTHFHLLLEAPSQRKENKGDISGLMHDLNSSYTKYFNGKYERKGHLFRERYKATLIEKGPYLLRLTGYIHLNPQRVTPAFNPQDYPYSSYMFYLNKELIFESPITDEKNEVLGLLNGKPYGQFMAEVAQELGDDLHKLLRKGIVGTEEFRRKAEEALKTYQREENRKTLSLLQVAVIITIIIVIAAAGFTYALKVVLKQRLTKITMPLSPNAEISAQIQKLLKDLEASEWQVRMVSAAGGAVQSDTLHFGDGKFNSENLNSKGYLPSYYSLIISDNNKIFWQAVMQRGTNSIASWQGEISRKEMRGTLTLRQAGLQTQEFSFISIKGRKENE